MNTELDFDDVKLLLEVGEVEYEGLEWELKLSE